MSYFMRAFCRTGELPSVSCLAGYLESKGISVHVESSSGPVEESCQQAIFRYRPDRTPIVIEGNGPDNKDELFENEIEEFQEKIGRPGVSLAKRKILQHLKQTKFILSVRLPSDIEPVGFQISDAILHYCINHCGALVQADDEGFYRGTKLILPLQ